MIQRNTCYKCYRPKVSCMCKHINPIYTKTKFVILMHPKEYRKTKNGTGHFTKSSLINSQLFIGIDFTNHKEINKILDDEENECFLLYPHEKSIKLNEEPIKSNKRIVLFLIDSTWPCSKKILRLSKNLNCLQKVSFKNNRISKFKIKTQPDSYCLSTIETTQYILELLTYHKIENLKKNQLKNFIKPFEKMVQYQVDYSNIEHKPRFKK